MELEGYVNSGKIRALYPILRSWINTNLQYLEYFNIPDCPWWYNERATLSTFAAAIWKANGIALEEYSIEKNKDHNHKHCSGRCDLFFGLQSDQFACESKQTWCAIGNTARNGIVNVEKSLREACNDAKRLPKEEGRRLGICFAVPYLPNRDEELIEQQLENWLEDICKSVRYDSISWLFPKTIQSKMKSMNGYFYPGVVMMIKEI